MVNDFESLQRKITQIKTVAIKFLDWLIVFGVLTVFTHEIRLNKAHVCTNFKH